MAGFGMVVADIQFKLESFRLSGWLMGLILSSMFLVQIPASQFWGKLADRTRPAHVLAFCTLLSSLSMFCYAFASAPAWVLLSRMLAGLGAANVAIAYSIASRTSTDDDRSQVMGTLGAASIVGLSIGSASGGIIADRAGSMALGCTAGALSALGIFLGLALGSQAPTSTDSEPKEPFSWRSAAMGPIVVISIVSWMGLALLEGTFGRLIKATLGYGPGQFGLVFGVESVVSFVTQGWVFARVSKRFPIEKMLPVAFAITGLGLALMPFARSLLELFLLGAVFSFGTGLSSPAMNDLIASKIAPEHHGAAYGAVQSAKSISFVVAPMLGGILFDLKPALPYLVAGGIAAVIAVSFGVILSRSVAAEAGRV
jgi:MFS family permease